MGTFGDIRRRIILLFVLGIGLPSSLLGYLALRGIRNDQALLERERREEFMELADAVVAVHDSALFAVGRELDLALIQADSSGGALTPVLRELVSNEPLIDAVFRFNADGDILELVAPSLLYHVSDQAPPSIAPSFPAAVVAVFEEARRQEFRAGNQTAALRAYQDLISGTSDPRIQAEALTGVARVQRAQGALDAAAESYRRLDSEFGDIRTAGGIPFSFAAAMELGRTQRLAGDTVSAAMTLVDLYRDLIRTRVGLSRASFEFISTSLQESFGELFSGSESVGPMTVLADTIETLRTEGELARANTERVLAFWAMGVEAVNDRVSREPEASVDGYWRTSVNGDGRLFCALLGEFGPEGEEDETGAWGLLLSPAALQFSLVGSLRDRVGSVGARWLLRGGSGEVLAASDGGGQADSLSPNDPVPVVRALPGGVPPVTIELYPPDEGFVRTLLTSRRGVFFYAFVLLAGILLFGLVLTVLTVSHQLALARLQSDFVSTVSHEFKSPLTAVRQAAEALQTGRVTSDEKRQRYYDLLLEQSERLSMLINRVLDFARMDSGRHTFDRRPVDLRQFLGGVVHQEQPRAEKKGIVIRSEIDSPAPTVSVDADALAQAVQNLIDNAIKYSGDSREIMVRCSAAEGSAVIAVQDFGVGLDPKEKAHVFERFYRGGDELTRSVRGTGLGLTLVKQIVEGHGGTIDVESELGQGSTFMIRLSLDESIA